MYKILLQNVHPNPEKRYSIDETISQMRNIYYQGETNEDLMKVFLSDDIYDAESIVATLNKEIKDINIIISVDKDID